MKCGDDKVEQILDIEVKPAEIALCLIGKVGSASSTPVRCQPIFTQPSRVPTRKPVSEVVSEIEDQGSREKSFLASRSRASIQTIPAEHMWPVVGPLLVEQLRILIPVEPSGVEGPVGEADEPGFVRPAALAERITHGGRIEPRRGLHDPRIAPCDFPMAQGRVEVLADTRPGDGRGRCPRETRRGSS